MAFKSAKSMGNHRTDIVRVVKKESNFLYIPNKLKKGDKGEDNKTEIRMLPYIDSSGEVYDALRSDGSLDEINESLGLAFCSAELLQFYKGGLYTFLTTVKDEDKQGNPVQGQTPWSKFMRRIDFKLAEMKQQVKAGGKVEPGIEHWLNFRDGTFSSPQNLFFIQCLAKKVQGNTKTKEGKIVPIGPGVFAIPRYIQSKTTFFEQMLNVDDDEAGDVDLSPKTCKLGDFYTLEEGRAMRLSRADIEGNTSYSMELAKKPWPLKAEDVIKMVSPWDDILDVMYIEDSIKEISKLMEPRMLAYAFRNTKFAPYIQELGIDVDIAKDIIEADVAIVKGERKRTAKEIGEHLGQTGSNTRAPVEDNESEEPEDDIQYTPSSDVAGDEEQKAQERYQEALGKMGASDGELSLG